MFKLGALVCLRTLAASSVKTSLTNAVKYENLISLKAQPVRNSSFFTRMTQKELWKGTTSVSNAGRRKGRGKERYARRNVNAGKRIGDGRVKVQWPGLNTPVMGEKEVMEVKLLTDAKTETKPVEAPRMRKRRSKNPLDRGWSGGIMKGKKIGPPNPSEGGSFENFQSIILEYKVMLAQTSLLGKRRKFVSVVGVGNGEGVFGFGRAKTYEGRSSLHLAKGRAVKKLLTVDLIETHTVNHDFFSQYGCTKVFVFKRPEGYGVVAHRIIKSVCELIGIKNLYAKVEGACNPVHIIRAFTVGLLRQKTYQEIADEKKLHLVEFRKECHNFPMVLASPKECLPQSEVESNPIVFEEYIMGGRLVKERYVKPPFYTKMPSWKTYLKRTSYERNHEKARIDLMVKYGSMRSHLTDFFPECVSPSKNAKHKEKATEVQ